MPSIYTFTEYSPDWPREFQREAARLRALWGDEVFAIHHVGSTSVPGLAAKPIIDLLPLVHNIERIDAFHDAMTAAGYKVWGEYGLPGRRYFTRDADGVRTHNIHTYAQNSPEALRHMAFPAYLRTHPDACAEYVQVKRRAYALHPADIDAYNDAKNDWIKATEKIALAWYQKQKKEQ